MVSLGLEIVTLSDAIVLVAAVMAVQGVTIIISLFATHHWIWKARRPINEAATPAVIREPAVSPPSSYGYDYRISPPPSPIVYHDGGNPQNDSQTSQLGIDLEKKLIDRLQLAIEGKATLTGVKITMPHLGVIDFTGAQASITTSELEKAAKEADKVANDLPPDTDLKDKVEASETI